MSVSHEDAIADRRADISRCEREIARLKTSRGSQGMRKDAKADAIAALERIIRDHRDAIERLAGMWRHEGAQPGNRNQTGGLKAQAAEPEDDEDPGYQGSTVSILAPESEVSAFVGADRENGEAPEPTHTTMTMAEWAAASRPEQQPAPQRPRRTQRDQTATGEAPDLGAEMDEDAEEGAEDEEAEPAETRARPVPQLPARLDAAPGPDRKEPRPRRGPPDARETYEQWQAWRNASAWIAADAIEEAESLLGFMDFE